MATRSSDRSEERADVDAAKREIVRLYCALAKQTALSTALEFALAAHMSKCREPRGEVGSGR